jgi:hypothetical protein
MKTFVVLTGLGSELDRKEVPAGSTASKVLAQALQTLEWEIAPGDEITVEVIDDEAEREIQAGIDQANEADLMGEPHPSRRWE